MIIRPLYRYIRADGGTTVSLTKPEGAYTEICRLIAADGKLLTKDGSNLCPSADVDSSAGWYEVDDPEIQYQEDYL